jgi:hypothetical protein
MDSGGPAFRRVAFEALSRDGRGLDRQPGRRPRPGLRRRCCLAEHLGDHLYRFGMLASGLLSVRGALPIIIGCNVGTTLLVVIASLDSHFFVPVPRAGLLVDSLLKRRGSCFKQNVARRLCQGL